MPIIHAGQAFKPQTIYRAVTGIEEAISLAETRWGWQHKRKSSKEAAGPCPLVCGGGDDRFILFSDGGYWCRQCGSTGWVTEESKTTLTPAEILERRVAILERQHQEMNERVSALERMARRTEDVDRYHANLKESAIDWWHETQGVSYESIANYKLGYCSHCPTAPGSDSYTIPYFEDGNLLNIRHRLANPTGGKYRPHMAGLGIALFQADILQEQRARTVLVEGEVKAIVLTQNGFPAVGIMGKCGFEDSWVSRFGKSGEVVIALDPDAIEAAWSLAQTFHKQKFGGKVKIARMPTKPDDLIVKHGATVGDMREFLDLARAA